MRKTEYLLLAELKRPKPEFEGKQKILAKDAGLGWERDRIRSLGGVDLDWEYTFEDFFEYLKERT